MGRIIPLSEAPPSWDRILRDAWGSVPSVDLLRSDDPFWVRAGLGGMPPHESASLALVGRLLKYGQSIAISLPLLGSDCVTRLIVYLHRLRFDALEGAIRTPWLNHANLDARPHLAFFSRPQERMRECSRVPDVHARIPRIGGGILGGVTNKAQTLLLNGTADVMELINFVHHQSKPFAFLLDATACGCIGIGELESALAESFPSVPRIVLLTLGCVEAEDRYAVTRARTHHWRVRLADEALLDVGSAAERRLHVVLTEDTTANSALASASAAYLALRATQARTPDPVLKQKLLILGKVLRGLTESVVPLEYLERTLKRETRSGLFPVRCLARWLEIAGTGTCAYGDTQASIDALSRRLSMVHSLLSEGVSGRSVALLAMANSLVNAGANSPRSRNDSSRKVTILCGTHYESLAVEEWFDAELPDDWRDYVSVSAMDGLSANRARIDHQDKLFITGMLWPNRQHWLAAPCSEVKVLCHPFEAPAIERVLTRWWDKYGGPSKPDGDKARLWTLDWRLGESLSDQDVVVRPPTIAKVIERYSGHYPTAPYTAEVHIDLQLDDWLNQLTAQPAEPEERPELGDVLAADLVWIHTREHSEPIAWQATRPILVLDEHGISALPSSALEVGQQILLLKYTEERVATQERLFEIVAREDEGLHQALKFASRWDEMVDTVSEKYSVRNIQTELRRVNASVEDQTVRNWLKHGVIGPRNPAVVRVFSRLAGLKDPERAARYTINGIDIVRNAHMNIGSQIRKALLERRRGASDVRIGTLHVDVETLDQMMELGTVTGVDKGSNRSIKASRPPSLVDIADATCARFARRLLLTKPAQKSLRECVYGEIDKFRVCLEIMGSHLFDHYRDKKTRLHEVLAKFTAISIGFAPLMSESTTGKFGDDRRYKGRLADMNKHLILGRAYDPTRTMRIHFEWDADDEVIVIHHAGVHLKTTQT